MSNWAKLQQDLKKKKSAPAPVCNPPPKGSQPPKHNNMSNWAKLQQQLKKGDRTPAPLCSPPSQGDRRQKKAKGGKASLVDSQPDPTPTAGNNKRKHQQHQPPHKKQKQAPPSPPPEPQGLKKKQKKKKKKKTYQPTGPDNGEAGGGSSGAKPSRPPHSSPLPNRNATRPPRPFVVPGKDGRRFLTPGDDQFSALMAHSYRDLVRLPAAGLPAALHNRVATALQEMVKRQLFHFDIVSAGKAVSSTFVKRTLVGDRGMTYHYQRLRIFAHPWDGSSGPVAVIRELNSALTASASRLLEEQKQRHPDTITGSCKFRVSLINYMQAVKDSEVPLRAEDQFGLGLTTVSWHADSSLEDFSTIAVYQLTGKPSDWSVAVRVVADEQTPAVRIPLDNQETYFMLNDFNHHHHHAVLAGNSWRFSSTHRVAVTSKDTYDYILSRCEGILDKLAKRSANQLDASLVHSAGQVHLELEFEWLRMFWLQGEAHAATHRDYWLDCIRELTQLWLQLEAHLARTVADLGRLEVGRDARCFSMCLYILQELHDKRLEFDRRCKSPAYLKLDKKHRPVERLEHEVMMPPSTQEAGTVQTLPRDLKQVISRVQGHKEEFMKH